MNDCSKDTDDNGWNNLDRVDTEYNADSAEWCLNVGMENVLTCGTYQLIENDIEANKRIGRLFVYTLEDDQQLIEHQRIDTSAILDMKWSCQQQTAVIALADAVGCITLYSATTDSENVNLHSVDSYCVDSSCIILSLDWSSSYKTDCLIASDSAGRITTIKCDSTLTVDRQWLGHAYEAWISAFDRCNSNIAYSGGDDCLLKGWDLRTDCSNSTFTSKCHSMGVCSIHCNQHRNHIIATGSYDENILIWDCRRMTTPLCRVAVGGGVWRLKWNPNVSDVLLAACMHNGFLVINLENYDCPRTLAHYKAHKSLAYGCDWKIDNEKSKNTVRYEDDATDFPSSVGSDQLVATCSFYDHSLHVSKCNIVSHLCM